MKFAVGQNVTFNDEGPRSGAVLGAIIDDEGDDDALIEIKCDDNGRHAIVYESQCELTS